MCLVYFSCGHFVMESNPLNDIPSIFQNSILRLDIITEWYSSGKLCVTATKMLCDIYLPLKVHFFSNKF